MWIRGLPAVMIPDDPPDQTSLADGLDETECLIALTVLRHVVDRPANGQHMLEIAERGERVSDRLREALHALRTHVEKDPPSFHFPNAALQRAAVALSEGAPHVRHLGFLLFIALSSSAVDNRAKRVEKQSKRNARRAAGRKSVRRRAGRE